jgi:sortase B
MQPPVEDNEYYLQHSWDGSVSSHGTIELDYRCSLIDDDDSPEETKNVLIYGHNLSNGKMFSNLEYYKSKSYWESNPLIEISTEDGQRLYEIYAVCSIYGLIDGTQFKYWDDKYINMDEDTFNEHLNLTKQTMIYDTGIEPEFGQDILTLQTCDGSNGWRIVIFAKRVK